MNNLASILVVAVGPRIDPSRLPLPPANEVRFIIEHPVSSRDAALLAEYAAGVETVSICVGHDAPLPFSLSFLDYFGHLDGFSLYPYEFKDFSELSKVPTGIASLALGGFKSKRLSLNLLDRFEHLESLQITGQTKDTEAIARRKNLRSLFLDQVTLPVPGMLAELQGLESFTAMHGGMSDLGVLSRLARLTELTLWRVRGLSEMEGLAILELGAMRQVQRLPPFDKLTNLKSVRLDQMKGLEEISTLAQARNLEQLQILEMDKISMASYKAFVGHPKLRDLTCGYRSKRKRQAVLDLLGLPIVKYPAPEQLIRYSLS